LVVPETVHALPWSVPQVPVKYATSALAVKVRPERTEVPESASR
jgi:hypothetical protein